MTAGMASETGIAFRFFDDGLAVKAWAGEVKSLGIDELTLEQHVKTAYIHRLSAIPPSRPRRHLLRVSSCPNFNSSSFDIPAFDMRTLLGVEGG